MALIKNKTAKVKPPQGKYVSQKDAATLKKAQNFRSAYMFGATLTLAVTLFLRQEWAAATKEVVWLQTLYVLLVFVMITSSVITSYGALRTLKLNGEISERYKPKAGFEKRTFASFEWFMIFHFLLAAAQIALVIYHYGPMGLIAALLTTAGAVLSYLARDISFKTLKSDLSYLPPPALALPADSAQGVAVAGESENTVADNSGSAERDSNGDAAENDAQGDETEDFYDEK